LGSRAKLLTRPIFIPIPYNSYKDIKTNNGEKLP